MGSLRAKLHAVGAFLQGEGSATSAAGRKFSEADWSGARGAPWPDGWPRGRRIAIRSALAVFILLIPMMLLPSWFRPAPPADTSEPGVVEQALKEISESAGSDSFTWVAIQSDRVSATQHDGRVQKFYSWENDDEVSVSEMSLTSQLDAPFRLSEVEFAGFARAWSHGLPDGQTIFVKRELDGPVTVALSTGADLEPLNSDFTRQ